MEQVVNNNTQICAEHKKIATFLRLKKQNNPSFYPLCNLCILDQKNKGNNDKISLEQIYDINDPSKFQRILNWPLGLEDIHSANLDKFAEINYQVYLTKQFDTFVERLQQEFNDKIKQLRNQYIEKIQKIIPVNNLKENYQDKFQIKNLIQIVKRLDCAKYDEFLTNFEATRQMNVQSFITQIEEIKKCETLVSFDHPLQKKQEILKLISEMDFFGVREVKKPQILKNAIPMSVQQMMPQVNDREKPKPKVQNEIMYANKNGTFDLGNAINTNNFQGFVCKSEQFDNLSLHYQSIEDNGQYSFGILQFMEKLYGENDYVMRLQFNKGIHEFPGFWIQIDDSYDTQYTLFLEDLLKADGSNNIFTLPPDCIEVRISIPEKNFQILEYPNYKKVIFSEPINQNKQYQLSIGSKTPNELPGTYVTVVHYTKQSNELLIIE